MKRVLVFGATSAIAQEAAKVMAARGDALFLVARDAKRLESVAADLRVRHQARVEAAVADARDHAGHAALVAAAVERLGGLDAVLVAHGTLPDPAEAHHDVLAAAASLDTNLVSVVTLLTPVADLFEKQRSGAIVVIGSVAGDRGRMSNYVYGTAKAGVEALTQGLRHRLARAGVRVVLVKPGFVDTPMTAHVKKGILFASAARVGRICVRALDSRRGVVYAPWFWRPIMLVVRAVPRFVMHRTRL